jgi:hypothetical protein
MIPRCETCPQSPDLLCHAYELLCQRHRQNPGRWRSVVLRHSAVISGKDEGERRKDELLHPSSFILHPSEPDPWLPLIRACEYHNPGCCSHPMPFCSLYLRDVTRDDCVACLTAGGISPDEAAQPQS